MLGYHPKTWVEFIIHHTSYCTERVGVRLCIFCSSAEFMFISYTYIQVDKQGPRDDHQDNQLPKFKLGPGTWLAKARSPQEIEIGIVPQISYFG